MGLFSKLKDYNVELDEILDNKTFSSNIKSLLLSMIYKIEISYVDFKEVKRCVRSKEDFLNEIVETVRLYCDNIKTVEPDSDQANLLIKNNVLALTNEYERSILAYPTEQSLLYAISEISPKYFYINQSFPLKDVIQHSLVNGYNLNNNEILQAFTGWSWDLTVEKGYNYIDHLIYQNLLVVLGEKFLYEWRTYGSTRRDFLEEAKEYVKLFTGNDNLFKELYRLVYANANPKIKQNLDEELKEKAKLLKKMENKAAFLEEMKKKKIKFTKRLEVIDMELHDNKLLEKELEDYNKKLPDGKVVKTLATYRKIVMKQRESILKELSEIQDMLLPKNFLKRKNDLEQAINLYGYNLTKEEILTNFEKEFLNFFDKRLSKMNTRDEIVDAIYELRYFRYLKYDEEKFTSDIDELEKICDRILKKAITKLCKLGGIRIISMDINLNYEIIRYALDTKIINLEETRLQIDKVEGGIIISVFDKDVIEKQGKKKVDIDKKSLEIRLKRKIKLFN